MRRSLIALAIVSLWALPSAGAAEERHSGTVLSADPPAGTFVLGELTASRSEAPAPVTRAITVGPGARVLLIHRSNDPRPAAWPGGFVASPISLADLRMGDFVTVVGQEHNGRLEATAVELSRDESSVSASPRSP